MRFLRVAAELNRPRLSVGFKFHCVNFSLFFFLGGTKMILFVQIFMLLIARLFILRKSASYDGDSIR